MTIDSKLHKTVATGERVYVGDQFFALHRFPNDEDGEPRIEVLTQHPHHPKHPFFLAGRPLREEQRYEVFPGVVITVRDASEQSRVKVTIEAPRKLRIGSTATTACVASRSPASLPASKVTPAPVRQVQLPPSATGALFLHRMPGRPPEPLVTTLNAIECLAISHVVCLVPAAELAAKSADYARFLAEGRQPWIHHTMPIPDFGVPQDTAEFWALAQAMAEFVRLEGRVLVHCAGGIGRTGMFATAVLMRLGLTVADAVHLVAQAGSGAETSAQRALLNVGALV